MQVYSTNKSKSESIIVDESSTEENKSENVKKSINIHREKYAIDKTHDEEPSVTDNTVINELRFLKLFYGGKNLLNRLDTTCEQACMTNSRDRHCTENFETLTDYNYCNNTPLSYSKIRDAICNVLEEESISDVNNVTEETFNNTSNTQNENANIIFTSKKLDKLIEMANTINNWQ